MKRNVVAALAVLSLVAAFAAPAAADLNAFSVAGPNAVPFAGQAGRSHNLPLRFGIVNSAGTDLLPDSSNIVANSSSNITVTFGVKWAYDQPYTYQYHPTSGGTITYNYGNWAVLGVRFNLFWDSNELSPTAAALTAFPGGGPAGNTMVPLNYSSGTIGGFFASVDASVTGTTGVGLFANRGPGTTAGNTAMTVSGGTSGGFGMSLVAHDQLMKVGKATWHVDPGAHPDDGLDLFWTGGVSGRFYTDVTTTTPTFGSVIMSRIWSSLIAPSSIFIFGAGPGGYDVTPEPASAALLGVGLFAVVGGVWRRRRRHSA
jgi:hypothetical protein